MWCDSVLLGSQYQNEKKNTAAINLAEHDLSNNHPAKEHKEWATTAIWR